MRAGLQTSAGDGFDALPAPDQSPRQQQMRPSIMARTSAIGSRNASASAGITRMDRILASNDDIGYGGITAEDVQDLMVATVEHRYGQVNRVPEPIEWLTDQGSCYTARSTRAFAPGHWTDPAHDPSQQSSIKRHGGGVRSHPQARLCSREPQARCAEL